MLELATDFAWGKSCADGTVGFVARGVLSYDEPTAPTPSVDGDAATLAESLIGASAKPGGRSPAGFDASGLIFYILTRTGHASPRFADLQADAMGEPVMGHAAHRRGELAFFADHAAIMVSATEAVHVTETVVREPLPAIVERFGPITARRRL